MAVSFFTSETETETLKVAADLVRLRTGAPLQFIDITELVRERVRRSGISDGFVNIQSRHTTAAIVINENEPLLLEDLERILEAWAPKAGHYRHDDLHARQQPLPPDERANGHSHARAVYLGTSETVNVVGGQIQLGRWQAIFLVELDGIRTRDIAIVVMGTKSGPIPSP